MADCIFCKIIAKQIPGEILEETEDLIVLKDIFPKAPVHLLVIPKIHIPSITDLQAEHESLVGKLILAAKDVAIKHGISENGYKLVFNVGKHGGQMVPHIHLHILGGKQLSE